MLPEGRNRWDIEKELFLVRVGKPWLSPEDKVWCFLVTNDLQNQGWTSETPHKRSAPAAPHPPAGSLLVLAPQVVDVDDKPILVVTDHVPDLALVNPLVFLQVGVE